MNKSIGDSLPSYTQISVSHYFLFYLSNTISHYTSLLLIKLLCSSPASILISYSMLFLHLMCPFPACQGLLYSSFKALPCINSSFSLNTSAGNNNFPPIFHISLLSLSYHTNYCLPDTTVICAQISINCTVQNSRYLGTDNSIHSS